MTTITRKKWSQTEDGQVIYKYILKNESGAYATVCNLGAAILGVVVPDKNGKMGDVVLGYSHAESYFGDGPCLGKCPGRFANRIDKGIFSLDGKEYALPVNCGPNHLHGGPEGFQNKVWQSRKYKDGVEFKYVSVDGEQGYPGNLVVVIRYTWSENNELQLTFSAKTDSKTIINLTNHAYFNLNGGGHIFRHYLKLNASQYLPTTESLIPLGKADFVKGTPMDFRKRKTLGRDIKEDFPALNYGKGYDACWVIDGYVPGQLNEAAELYSNKSGRVLKVYTTQPGIQVYTGNWLEGCPKGKNARIYHDYDGVALECQHFPDSPNQSDYPSTVLKKGQKYNEAIIYAFGVIE